MPDVYRFNEEKQEGAGFYEEVLKENAGARSPNTDLRSVLTPRHPACRA